jgi:hypothetical protein
VYVNFYFEASTELRVPVVLRSFFLPGYVGHVRTVNVGKDTSFALSCHVAKDVNRVVYHSQIWINPVPACANFSFTKWLRNVRDFFTIGELGVAIIEIPACSYWIFSCPNWFPHPFQILSHRVDSTVHFQKLYGYIIFVVTRLSLGLLTLHFVFIFGPSEILFHFVQIYFDKLTQYLLWRVFLWSILSRIKALEAVEASQLEVLADLELREVPARLSFLFGRPNLLVLLGRLLLEDLQVRRYPLILQDLQVPATILPNTSPNISNVMYVLYLLCVLQVQVILWVLCLLFHPFRPSFRPFPFPPCVPLDLSFPGHL